MKSSTKRILSIGLSGVFFIATLFVYGNFIQPALGDVEKKRSEVAAKETLFVNQRNAIKKVQALIGQIQAAEQARLQETVSLALPLSENTTQVLHQLQAIVRQSQVGLRSFDLQPLAFEPSKQPIVKRLGVLELQVVVDGSYESIKSFLRGLETNVRVANVKDFKVVTLPALPLSLSEIYTLTLKAELYYQD